MNQPFFSRALGFSLALHISIVVIAFLVASFSPSRKIAPSYVVTLVAPPGDAGTTAAASAAPEAAPAPAESKPETKTKPEPVPQKKSEPAPVAPKRTKQEKLADDQLLSDRVAALKAKKRIEKMVAQRRTAEISKSKTGTSNSGSPQSKTKGGKPGGGDYVSLVTSRIHQNWIYPESSPQNLEMTVLLRVRKDGSASVERVIKGSGNPLFDRSVQRAITKSSPFPPPPQEMEIQATFSP